MTKYIFYKELIKTKQAILLLSVIMFSIMFYMNIDIYKTVEISSRETLCLKILTKDTVLFSDLIYMHVTVGLIFSIAQYVPEIYHKRLKLTLHLPVSTNKIVFSMITFAMLVMFLMFSISFLWIYIISSIYLPKELVEKVITTHLVWIVSGFTSYGLVAWTLIEPNAVRKISNGVISIITISIFFISPYPQSYDNAFFFLCFISVLSFLFIWLSINRFKSGL